MGKQNKQAADHIIKDLYAHGFDGYIVGGAVRDIVMGKIPADYDIATNASPEELQRIFNGNCKVCGEVFSTCIIDGVEVASFRKDIHHGIGDKHCHVETGKHLTIYDDLSRRDFTINAMALSPLQTIIDPYGGLHDLRRGIVRFVGSPAQRIMEDPNRLLRLGRMLSKINGTPNVDSYSAVVNHIDMLKHVSPERIRMEILKAMECEKPSIFWEFMHVTGMLKIIMPELDACFGKPGGKHHSETVWEHLMLVGDSISPKFPLVRLAGYLHDIGKPHCWDEQEGSFLGHAEVGREFVSDILANLKFSGREIDFVSGLVGLHMRSIFASGERGIRRTMCRLVQHKIKKEDFVRLLIADNRGNKAKKPYSFSEIKKILRLIDEATRCGTVPNLPSQLAISGHDVMQLTGLTPGPMVGSILRSLFAMVEENPEANTKEFLEQEVIKMQEAA